ncbi:uncharacterized protein ACBR49_005534 [Aulostomus maculatus]
MACADVDMNIHGNEEELSNSGQRKPVLAYYRPTEQMPNPKGHYLQQKQPAVLGGVQIVSGLLSVALGLLFAATQRMEESLFTLFRISQLTGILFIAAGLLSCLLIKYPRLLSTSLKANCGAIIAALAAVCLIGVDLAHWNPENDQHLRMEALELCILCFEIFLSALLCFWFYKEKEAKRP